MKNNTITTTSATVNRPAVEYKPLSINVNFPENNNVLNLETVKAYINILCLENAIARTKGKDAFKKSIEKIETAHAETTWTEVSESDIKVVLDAKEYEAFCKSRAYLENCEERLETIKTATGFSKETFKALPRADKIFITVYARKTDNSIILKKADLQGLEITGLVKFFSKGDLSVIKKSLIPVFHKTVGNGIPEKDRATLFKPLKIRKSGIDNEYLRHFCARFSDKAKTGKDNKFNYGVKSGLSVQLSALTELFAVIIDNNCTECTGYTAEPEKPEKPEKAEKAEKPETTTK